MIEKLDVLRDAINVIETGGMVHTVPTFVAIEKINELVDIVNSIASVQEKLIDSRFVVETKHEEPVDKFAEQKKWIGKLCKFWDDNPNDCVFDKLKEITLAGGYIKESRFIYEHCEPVSEDLIYKGE